MILEWFWQRPYSHIDVYEARLNILIVLEWRDAALRYMRAREQNIELYSYCPRVSYSIQRTVVKSIYHQSK